nr:GDP-mannose 4,6-dehydratase [uncultured Desulfobacter sp.]
MDANTIQKAIDQRGIKRVLITGITGSGGSYMAEYIAQKHPDIEIHGISRWHSTSADNNLSAIKNQVIVHECDLCDLSSVFRTLQKAMPDGIFHLAAHANVRACFDTPLAVLNNNINSTANLFEAVRMLGIEPYIQLCSTSEVYGQVDPQNVPITEECPINPSSPYAVSKVTQDHLGYTYFRCYGTKIIRTRMFAYVNPRRGDLFATSFARQVALIESGRQDLLRHGNLESVRTLVDVRDAMEAYWLALLFCDPGEAYNIGGKTSVSVGEFLGILKKYATCPIPSEVDPKLLRPADVTLQIPDISKFVKKTAWAPKYSFEESVQLLLSHARSQI